ncbi:hypothetical protein L873DRAFT_1831744 [Choiromyces venosus 120613-1]|uniref:Uncharacterized protein n=1 Tax=Choiromyces venosus 120613-1 TaxID=1336337 RepID=A0A3N4IWE5_9PEZI|nr:hypothetical protein L873DRAFT_1831744 [Choiromyces venosus 120613-1]
MEGSSTGRSLSAALVETSKEGRKGDNSKIAKSKKAAKRSFTDGSIDTEGFGRVASEWRAAKGRSKTMHDVITLSDNESHFAQEIPEKKKKAVRQKKSATVGEGAKKGAKGGAAAAKKGKGKGKGKAVVNDSEDDGAFSDEGSVQHPISNPNDATTDEVVALDSKQTPGRKPTSNQVMIAVAIESPPKSAQKRKSTAGKAEEVGPPGDTMESNFDLVYENPQHDYESAPPSPEPVVPAKRAASGASVGGRKKKTREELEDEDDNWDEKPKKATKKAGVKGKNTKVLDVAAEAVAVIEDEAEIEVPPLKSAAKGRAAKGGKTAAAKAKAAKNLSAEEEVVEQKPEEAEETPGAGRRASALKTEDKKEALAPAEPQADIQPTKAETETTPAPPERKSATPASTSKITSTPTPGRVPFRVGLSRNSRIPSLLKGFRK